MIKKVSEITYKELADYIRVDSSDVELQNELNTYLNVAKNYISNYIDITIEELDKYQDLVIVVYILVQDMYDNRVLYTDGKALNHTVDSILNLYKRNLL